MVDAEVEDPGIGLFLRSMQELVSQSLNPVGKFVVKRTEPGLVAFVLNKLSAAVTSQ